MSKPVTIRWQIVALAALLLVACQPEGPDFLPAGRSNIQWNAIFREENGMAFVRVPDGCFRMGSREGGLEEQPVVEVCLTAFWIGMLEVTNLQYAACVDAEACSPPADTHYYQNLILYDGYPVVNITWEQAAEFAQWMGGALPTEAQWEYAARGTQGTPYPWGDTPPVCDMANIDGCGRLRAVGPNSRPAGASWVGALDMAGSVWEWTADWYADNTYITWRPGQTNPVGPEDGRMRVIRGGAWDSTPEQARAAFRGRRSPVTWEDTRGFRIVLYD